jgi:hypothetical protein
MTETSDSSEQEAKRQLLKVAIPGSGVVTKSEIKKKDDSN